MALTKPRRQAELGEVIAAAFEAAGDLTDDPRVAAELATAAVADLLARTGNLKAARKLSGRGLRIARVGRRGLRPHCEAA